MNALPLILSVRLCQLEAESALPNAPVVQERYPSARSAPVLAVRSGTARALRFAADWIAPQASPSCAC